MDFAFLKQINQDLSDHSASKEPKNPLESDVKFFIVVKDGCTKTSVVKHVSAN